MWIRLLVGVALVVLVWRWLVRPGRGTPVRAADGRAQPAAWDPYAVLGVASGASPEEIARAYHAQMKLYHPDRVAALGHELRELAHRKTLDIQRAYAELGGRI